MSYRVRHRKSGLYLRRRGRVEAWSEDSGETFVSYPWALAVADEFGGMVVGAVDAQLAFDFSAPGVCPARKLEPGSPAPIWQHLAGVLDKKQ
jgi:hypothetical protein